MSTKGFYITDDDITTKTKFVAAIRKFLATGETTTPGDREYRPSRGELELVHAIADYFVAHDEIVDKESGLNWLCDLGRHLVDAFVEFRTHEKHTALREIYRSQTEGNEIPDLLDIRGGYTFGNVTRDLTRLMPMIAGRCGGEWLERDLESTFQAQSVVIDHAWRRFVRECYRPIAPRIKAESHRGNSGLFGRTTLRSYVMAGRIMFTFARSDKLPDVAMLDKLVGFIETEGVSAENKLAAIEALLMTRQSLDRGPDAHQVSFVGDDSDMTGCRSGMNYPNTPYTECVAMIEDVIANWKPDRFVEDRHVSLG
jgi:hypothetical protein